MPTRRNRNVLLWITVSALLAGCRPPAADTVSEPVALLPPAEVVVARVECLEAAPTVDLVGTVLAARRSVIGSAVDGRVTQADFDEGDAIETAGQVIAQLREKSIDIQIASAAAAVELRKQQLAELVAGTRSEEVAQAQARWQAAEASAGYARARFNRLEGLFQQAGSVSQEEFEEARSASVAGEQQSAAARAAYDLAVAGPRAEQIAQARASLLQQQEEVRQLQDLRDKHSIRAPFPGYIIAKHTEVGAWLSRGDPVAEIAEMDPIDIELQVPEYLVSAIHLGQQVPITIDALPAGERTLNGVVHRIVPSAEMPSRSFPVKLRVHNPKSQDGYRLKEGMFARATIRGRVTESLIIPAAALAFGSDSRSVVVLDESPDGKPLPRRVAVETGAETNQGIAVRGNLKAGERVVVAGPEAALLGQRDFVVVEN